MSNVRSMPLKSPRPGGQLAGGCSSVVGLFFLLLSIGPLFFLFNGGYSIVGMHWLAEHAGEYTRLFWALASSWTVNVPIAARAGLPADQPIIPWLMVVGFSFLQVGLFIRRLRGDRIEPLLDTAGAAVSVFDFATTAVGLMFAPFTASLGALVYLWMVLAIGFAIPITFGFEALLARVLKGR